MSTPRPWSTDIATYFAQLDGSPPPGQFDAATPRLGQYLAGHLLEVDPW
jgi:hypothetical protein